MPDFYLPDPTKKTVYNAQNQPLDYNTYLAQGGAKDFSNVKRAPLPQLNAQGQASYAQPPDPITQFNTNLMTLLQKAQGLGNNSALMAQRNKVQNIGLNNSTAPAADLGIQNLAPGDMLRARSNEQDLYNPEVKALNDRMQLNNEAVTRFEGTLKAAKDWGEEYEKLLKPDDNTIQAVQMQMHAGIKPTAEVLAKIGNKITQADWDALAKASGSKGDDPSSYKEYALTDPTPTPVEYAKFLDRNHSGGGAPTTQTERLISEREGIVAKVKGLSRGKNGFANPNEYLDQASLYINKNGTPADFIASVPPERYLSPSDAIYVKSLLIPPSGRNG